MRVILSGYTGKMGQAVIAAATQSEIGKDFEIVAGVAGHNCTSALCPVYNTIEQVKEQADCVIDFSRPESLRHILPYCREKGIFAVIGTTALSQDDEAFVDSYAPHVPIFRSNNMSLGVNLQLQLIQKAAATLGESFDTEIIEKHHRLKVDAPSGTALMLADALNRQYSHKKDYTYGRYTKTERRKQNEIGIHSVRGGTIVGEHEVYFIGTDEILEINHKAYSKQVFALGALRAAKFMRTKQPGIYSMQDIMIENDVLSNLYVTDGQSLVVVSGLNDTKRGLRDVFTALGRAGVFVDMISQTSFAEVSFTVKSKQLYAALDAVNALKNEHKDIRCNEFEDISKLTIEGVGMAMQHGVAGRVFRVLDFIGVEPLIVATGETKISVGIVSESVAKAVNAVAEEFDL